MAPVRMSLGVVNVLLACGWSFSSRSSASQPQRQQRHPHKDSHQQHEEVTTHVCDIGTTYASYHDASRLHTTSNTRSTTTTAKNFAMSPEYKIYYHNNDETTSTTRRLQHPQQRRNNVNNTRPEPSTTPESTHRRGADRPYRIGHKSHFGARRSVREHKLRCPFYGFCCLYVRAWWLETIRLLLNARDMRVVSDAARPGIWRRGSGN